MPLLRQELFNAHQGSLCIEGIKYGFHQQKVSTAIHQALHLLRIGIFHLIEGSGPKSGIVHIGGKGGGFIGWTNGSSHKPWFFRIYCGELFSCFSSDPGRLKIDVVYSRFGMVVRLGDGGGIEGVGFNNIRSRFQVGFMDLPDHIRPGDGKQVIVSLQIAGVIFKSFSPVVFLLQLVALNHGPHGSIKHKHAFLQDLFYVGFFAFHVVLLHVIAKDKQLRVNSVVFDYSPGVDFCSLDSGLALPAQGLLKIGNDIINVFQSHRNPEQGGSDPGGQLCFFQKVAGVWWLPAE